MATKKFGYKKYMKQNKEKKDLSTLKIFVCSFVVMLVVFTVLINCFSPDVDVSIGNATEETTVEEEDVYLKKFVDDRLVALQQEDLGQIDRNSMLSTTEKAAQIIEATNKTDTIALKPVELVVNAPEVKVALPNVAVQNIPQPQLQTTEASPTYRVYIGHYHTYDQAKIAKEIVNETDSQIAPVIKEVGGGYTLQAGVFKNKEAAQMLNTSLLKEHLPARMVIEQQ